MFESPTHLLSEDPFNLVLELTSQSFDCLLLTQLPSLRASWSVFISAGPLVRWSGLFHRNQIQCFFSNQVWGVKAGYKLCHPWDDEQIPLPATSHHNPIHTALSTIHASALCSEQFTFMFFQLHLRLKSVYSWFYHYFLLKNTHRGQIVQQANI